jgi:hypothetical protein
MHVIRLRGPWQAEPLSGGMVRYSRRFHRPTGLDGGDRVFLVVDEAAAGAILLNGQSVANQSGRFDITNMLAATNFLTLAAPTNLDTEDLARLEIGDEESSHR